MSKRILHILGALLFMGGLFLPIGAEAALIAHWTLDEGSGQTAGDSVGTNDGTLGTTSGVDANDPTWACVSGGNALDFDGTDDLIQVGDAPALVPSGDMTVAAWVKLDALATTRGESGEWRELIAES